MASWRILGILVVALGSFQVARAQTYNLTEAPQAGDCFGIHLSMSLSGEMHVERNGENRPIKLSAAASHAFAERVLAVGPTGLPIKVARRYETAKASVSADGERSEKSLRPEASLIVAQRPQDQLTCYGPAGPLTREELELTSEHLDTLALTGLLPGKAVAIGETWKISNAAAQALCGFEGLIKQELTGKLEAVNGDEARIAISGTANGIDVGAMAKLTVQATGKFDLKAQRLSALEWKQQDEREIGPAQPATHIEATTTLSREYFLEQPKTLSDAALNPVPEGFDVPANLLQLLYRDPQNRFTLNLAREWRVTARTDEHLTLRLMERGDFVTQVTISPWTKAERGLHMTPKDFREIVEETPGLEDDEVHEDGESRSEHGHYVYRFSALGEAEGLKTLHLFYLVAGAEGDQIVFYFTLRQTLADKLGTRDLALVNGLDFPKSAEK
jgi:hypothetical protein